MDSDGQAKLLREIRDDQRAVLALLREAREARERDRGGARLLRGLLWVVLPLALLVLLAWLRPYARYMFG